MQQSIILKVVSTSNTLIFNFIILSIILFLWISIWFQNRSLWYVATPQVPGCALVCIGDDDSWPYSIWPAEDLGGGLILPKFSKTKGVLRYPYLVSLSIWALRWCSLEFPRPERDPRAGRDDTRTR